jgi:hypothetical protein
LFPAGITLFALALAVFSASRVSEWPVKPPPCMLRTTTGIPCPGCGATRAFAALAHGDAVSAFTLNPLAVTAVGIVMLWFAFALIATTLPGKARAAVNRRIRGSGKRWVTLAIIAAVAHWIYLVVSLE